jgi:hypothetical protein
VGPGITAAASQIPTGLRPSGEEVKACVQYAAGVDPNHKFVPAEVVQYVQSKPECVMVVALVGTAADVDKACGAPSP